MPNVNTSKHRTILKAAIKRLKTTAETRPSGEKPTKHMFYMLSNRKTKSTIVHLGIKAGKKPDKVKNPNAIRGHLKTVVGDKQEESLEALLGQKAKDITPQSMRKLNSCAGQVYVAENVMHFDITQKQGGGTPAELSKALKGIKQLLGDTEVQINGLESGESDLAEKEDGSGNALLARREKKLDVFNELKGAITDESTFFDALEKSGLSLGDLDELGPELSPEIQGVLEQINTDFDNPGAPFEARVQNMMDMVAELAIDSWEINMKGGQEGVERQKTKFEDALNSADPNATEISIPGETFTLPNGKTMTTKPRVLKKRGDVTPHQQLQDLIDSTDEALIVLDFGQPEELQKRLAASFDDISGIDKRKTKMDNISHNKDRETIEDGITQKEISEGEISMPISAKADERHKLLMVKLLTDENIDFVEQLMTMVDIEVHSESGDSRKNPENIAIKAHRPDVVQGKDYKVGVEHIRDSFRFKSVVKNITDIPTIFKHLVDNKIELVKIDTDKLFNPKGGEAGWGWRIIAFDLRMPNGQIVEWYLPLQHMEEEKKRGHVIFEEWRTVKVDELTGDRRKKYDEDQKKSYANYTAAFKKDMAEMGFHGENAMENMKAEWDRCVEKIKTLAKGGPGANG